MNLFRSIAIFAVCVASTFIPSFARGATLITATITVTNVPGVGTNWTVNGNSRTWTNNSGTPPASWITTGASIGASATNLYLSIIRYPYTGPSLIVSRSSSNVIVLRGTALTVTTNNYFTLSYSTNVGTNLTVIQVPFENVDGNTNRTNNAHWLVDALNTYPITNRFNTNAHLLGNFLTKGPSTQQVVTAPVQFNATLRGAGGIALTNGFTSATTNINPVSTNLINFGNAIRSDGSGGNSLQVGSNATASGSQSIAIGNDALSLSNKSSAFGISAVASNINAVAIGLESTAFGAGSLAIGRLATSHGVSDIALGQSSIASGGSAVALGVTALATNQGLALGTSSLANTNSTAVGTSASAAGKGALAVGISASAANDFSAAIGPSDFGGTAVATTDTNQIRIGTANQRISIPGQVLISGTMSNTTFRGTNIAGGAWGYPRFDLTTLAAGNNIAVPFGTNRYIRLGAAPGAASSICGAVGGATSGGLDGQDVIVFNDTGYAVTFEENTVDPVPANRFDNYSGAVAVPDQGFAMCWYDRTDSRWRAILLAPISVTATNALQVLQTNGVTVTATLTTLNVLYGTNIVIRTTNTAGVVDMLIASAAAGGGVDGSANSNLTYTVGANLTNHVNNADVALTNALLGKVDELNGVATNLTIYSGSPGLTVRPVPGWATNSFQVMATNGNAPVLMVNSNDVTIASNLLSRGYVQANSFNNANYANEKILITDSTGNYIEGGAFASEAAHLSGVTSAIQTQFAGKQNGQTNENQFGASTTLSLKDGARITNLVAVTGLTLEGSGPGHIGLNNSAGTATAYIRSGATNNVTVTNLVGVVHVTAASVVGIDFNQSHNWSVTNRIGAAASYILTNALDGQTCSIIIPGEVSGGTSRVITLVANTGQLIANLDTFGTALATSYAQTLTNGNFLEINDSVRRVNGTNIHFIVTRQGAF